MDTFATAEAVNLNQFDDRVRRAEQVCMYYEHSPGSFQPADPPTSNPLGLTVGKRHSEGFFRQSKGFAKWFCVAWIKPSHASTALPATCRA